MGILEEERRFFSIFTSNLYILLLTTLYLFIFGGKTILHSKKPKLTKKEIKNLNWGEIEKKLGIDSSEEPSKKIKMRIMQDSVFARECKWFTNKDIEKWLKNEDRILKSFNRTFKSD